MHTVEIEDGFGYAAANDLPFGGSHVQNHPHMNLMNIININSQRDNMAMKAKDDQNREDHNLGFPPNINLHVFIGHES